MLDSIPALLIQKLPRRTRAIVRACLYGLAGGGAAVAFQLGVNYLYAVGLVRLSHQALSTFLIGSFVVMVVSAALVGLLMHSLCPEAAGSGIPQLKLAFWKEEGRIPFRVACVKFLAGILSIGGGASLGREGPSVQIAGAVASSLAKVTGEAADNRRIATAAGASAGLAAAFNTPLAATTFVLEEIIGDLNSRMLGSVLLAAVLGALVVHGMVGKQPAFTLSGVDAPSLRGYGLIPLVAAVAALVAVAFQRLSLGLRTRAQHYTRVPRWSLPMIGALCTWALGATMFWRTGHLGIFSLGYGDLSTALAGQIGWHLALALLIAKFMATSLCYGFGGCGGIFSPTLFLGGMVGVTVAGLASVEMPIPPADALTLTVVGMSACLGTVVGAPVTGILIVFEMTHEFALVPALMIGALISQTIGRKMCRANFYDALLCQDGHQIENVRPPRDLAGFHQMPISSVANMQPVMLHRLDGEAIRTALATNPYHRFPVQIDGRCVGILTRDEAETALAQSRQPFLATAVTCEADQTVLEVQQLMIASSNQCVVVLDRPAGTALGFVTIHDLLRAQSKMVEGKDDLRAADDIA